ncbi:MAG TPA: hypothetical protein ENH25_04450 [candidate division Zixibacteria bacterium]|nr:hypothetical protein [candidate division Zixibacteria bacterium]
MMKKIINILYLFLLAGLLSARPAYAGIDPNALYTTTNIIHLVVLICAALCLIWALKILTLVKGGLISKSWQMFVLGFCFLIAAQLTVVGENVGLLLIPTYITTALYLLMTITWLAGLYQTRRVLG